MAKLANPFVSDLLDLAEVLARQSGRANFRQAAARRAVSSAYYAVFHALCTICTRELAGWSRADLVGRTYRALDHAVARKRLAVLALRSGVSPGINRLGVAFGALQDQRHLADYARPGSLFSDLDADAAIANARDMVAILEDLTREERCALAIELLVAKPR